MNSESVFQEECKDDFQWATEFGYLNKVPAPSHPVASSVDRCHQLMVFSGLHAGASMQLADGIYSLGRSYDCDIVLKDPGIEPVHLKVICNAGTIALHPELGAVYLDGELISGETILPESPVVATIADVHFGLAVEGAVWSPFDFPRINKDVDPHPGINHDKLDPQSASTTIINALKAALNRLQRANSLSKFVPVAFILLFIVSAMFFFHVKTPDEAALIADIEKQFTERQIPKPAIQFDTEGFLNVTAYVPTISLKQEITALLQALPVAVQLHVYVEDQIVQALQDYISRMAFQIDAAYQGNGRVLVKGFVDNQQEADVVGSLLKSNVMGLSTVDLHIRQMNQVRPELAAILKEAGLTDKINIHPQSGHLLAEGTLNAKEHARWQTAKETILERLGRPMEIVDQVNDQESAENIPGKIDIPIAGVTMEPYPFITLQDGKVYFKGASLQNGSVIKDIGLARIVVEIDGRDYYYNF